jgi:cardiolipin synthase
LNIPNIITLARIILVPVPRLGHRLEPDGNRFRGLRRCRRQRRRSTAFWPSDQHASELGALLDPLADKALLVSIYVALGIWGAVPRWIVILVCRATS